MNFFRRLTSVLLAIFLLSVTIYLGIRSGENSKFVIWFGIASAIAAPIGLALFGYAISSSHGELIQRLAKIPEIEKLI